MGCMRTVFGFMFIVGTIMSGMGILQTVMSFFGYTYESLQDFGDPTEAGITLIVLGAIMAGIGKGVDFLLEKIQERRARTQVQQP